MLVELGPLAAADVCGWIRFARRVIVELRVDPHDLEGVATDDLLRQWSGLIDEWAQVAQTAEAASTQFRWSTEIDSEVAEFLLHGFERVMRSPGVQAKITEEEAETRRPFSLHVVGAFVDGLEGEGTTHGLYADQIRASLGSSLD